jgi:hypothetical protein
MRAAKRHSSFQPNSRSTLRPGKGNPSGLPSSSLDSFDVAQLATGIGFVGRFDVASLCGIVEI